MPRPKTPMKLAINKLLNQKGEELTHAEAVPMLVEAGKKDNFSVVENPGPKSEDLLKMEGYKLDWEDDANIQAVADVCELSAAALQRVKKEAAAHRIWKLQENQFNVAKNTWKKEQAGGVSKRPGPETTKNVRAKAAKTEQKKKRGRPPKEKTVDTPVAAKRGRPPKVVATTAAKRGRPPKIVMPSMDDLDMFAALKYVESHGKLPGVQEMLAKAQAEVTYLQRVLELHANLCSRATASKKDGKVAKAAVA